jgi:Ulp1 family protease
LEQSPFDEKDLGSLKGTEWLTGQIIRVWMEVQFEQFATSSGGRLVAEAHFYGQLSSASGKEYSADIQVEGRRRPIHASATWVICQDRQIPLQNVQVMVLPIHSGSSHWSMAALDKATSTGMKKIEAETDWEQVSVSEGEEAFTSEVLEEFHLLMGVKAKFTVEYNQQNGMVERRNKEVLRLLRALVFDHNAVGSWSSYLPIVQNILNNSNHGDISPNDLVFGLANNSRRTLFLSSGGGVVSKTTDLTKFWTDSVTVQQRMMQKSATDEVVIEKAVPQQFQTDTWVLVDRRRNAQLTADLSKLAPVWLGPYQVRGYDGRTGVYEVEDFTNSATGKNLLRYHVSQLKEFVKRGSENPVTIAGKDRSEHVVMELVQHTAAQDERQP